MITSLFTILIVGLVLLVIFILISKFVADARIMQIIGLIFALILIVYALKLFHVALP